MIEQLLFVTCLSLHVPYIR